MEHHRRDAVETAIIIVRCFEVLLESVSCLLYIQQQQQQQVHRVVHSRNTAAAPPYVHSSSS